MDRKGELLGARIAEDGQWRFPGQDSIPYKYKQCLVLYEDRYFYSHPGVNPLSLLRAMWQNLKAGRVVSGGSTISMQVIRLSRRGKSRTLSEKILEMFLAIRLELSRSKDDILSLYAAHAPFGGNVVGLEAAAWRYYGRPPGQLTWAESATLAVLPNAPSLIHPGRNRPLLLEKRNRLLTLLRENDFLDSLDCSLACLEPLPDEPLPLPALAPHLLDRVTIDSRGEKISSTLDADIQRTVAAIVGEHSSVLESNEIHNAACLVLETRSGEVLAYVGNTGSPDKAAHSGDVDIIMSPRSTGSILKPLLFCMMLEEGKILTGSLVPDIPTQYTGYAPKNFSPGYDGAVPARRALARSLNVPAVRMLQSYGVERFHYRLRELGMSTLTYPSEHYGLSLILGGAETTLWWITGTYASMGRILENYTVTGKYTAGEIREPVFTPAPRSYSKPENSMNPYPFSAASIWLTFQSLIQVNRPLSQAGWKSFESASAVAWKTGTSFGFRDGWAVATGPLYTVGVWAGNADGEGRPGLTGIGAAAPILFDVLERLPPQGWFRPPLDELHPALVCRQSGFLPGPNCPDLDTTWVTERGLQSPPCPYHLIVHLTRDGRYRVNRDCMDPGEIIHVPWFVLPPLMEWYYRSRNPDYRVLPDLHPDCSGDGEIAAMEMIYPRHSSRVYIPRELDGSRGRLILEAAHRNPSTTIYWHLNGDYLGCTSYIHQMEVVPPTGPCTLTLVDAAGNTLVRRFEVIDHEE